MQKYTDLKFEVRKMWYKKRKKERKEGFNTVVLWYITGNTERQHHQ